MHEEPSERLPAGGGAYCLVLHLDRARKLSVGALGDLQFRAGHYCYVGSARSGLRSRLARHLRSAGKRRFWHVDYLREAAEPVGVLTWIGPEADECALSRLVAAAAEKSVLGFGCTDCGCASHLHYFRGCPGRQLGSLAPSGAEWQDLPQC